MAELLRIVHISIFLSLLLLFTFTFQFTGACGRSLHSEVVLELLTGLGVAIWLLAEYESSIIEGLGSTFAGLCPHFTFPASKFMGSDRLDLGYSYLVLLFFPCI